MRAARDDDGTILPVVLGFFVLAALLVLGGAAASSAFLAQRDLVAYCDSVAVAAADSVSEGGLYAPGRPRVRLPLSDAGVDAVVASLRPVRRDVQVSARVRGADRSQVEVSCATSAPVAFGALVGRPTVSRRAVASAQSPYSG